METMLTYVADRMNNGMSHTPTPKPTSSAASIRTMTAKEYATACGRLMQREIGSDEGDFVSWVVELTKLQPPPELQEFHQSITGQFVLQIETSGNTVNVVGPNEDTQFWYEVEVVSEMPSSLGRVL